jgi:polyisoprenoid-binding protein YceI
MQVMILQIPPTYFYPGNTNTNKNFPVMNIRFFPKRSGWFALLLPFQFALTPAFAQIHYTGGSADLVISGTSTLHDWTMKDVKADCNVLFDLNGTNQVTSVKALNFSTPATALKSDHSSMDNNAYKALRTDKDPLISYTMTMATVAPQAQGSTVTVTGKLTVAGVSRDEEIVAVCKSNPDNTITVTGSKKISMAQYNIQPPTFMLGTIKTGNDIVVSFTVILKKS